MQLWSRKVIHEKTKPLTDTIITFNYLCGNSGHWCLPPAQLYNLCIACEMAIATLGPEIPHMNTALNYKCIIFLLCHGESNISS